MYFAIDGGHSNNTSQDTHKLLWFPFEDVDSILSYPSLKHTWNIAKNIISEILNTKQN